MPHFSCIQLLTCWICIVFLRLSNSTLYHHTVSPDCPKSNISFFSHSLISMYTIVSVVIGYSWKFVLSTMEIRRRISVRPISEIASMPPVSPKRGRTNGYVGQGDKNLNFRRWDFLQPVRSRAYFHFRDFCVDRCRRRAFFIGRGSCSFWSWC